MRPNPASQPDPLKANLTLAKKAPPIRSAAAFAPAPSSKTPLSWFERPSPGWECTAARWYKPGRFAPQTLGRPGLGPPAGAGPMGPIAAWVGKQAPPRRPPHESPTDNQCPRFLAPGIPRFT
ncbi:hypothetical protein GCM10020229_67090 [Kitasatospora albolonga]